MRKQTKLVAVLSAAALLAIGASAVAFAEGWDYSTGAWQWLDKDGIPVSAEWRKSANDWFYLGDDGNMVVEDIVEYKDNYYYVNEQGAMVSNVWMPIENEDGDWDCDYFYYRFDANGKALKGGDKITASKIKEINGKEYAFSEDGKMLYGWVKADEPSNVGSDDASAWEDADYYFGDWTDGSMRTGWQKLPVEDEEETKEYWFFFDTHGKKIKADDGELKEKKIDGKTYIFDDRGVMVSDWAAATGTDVSTTSGVKYVNGDGAVRKNTWIWSIPAENQLADNEARENEDAFWWYAGNTGELVTNSIKKINGKYYAFNEYGQMLSGLVVSEKLTDGASAYKNQKLSDVIGADFDAETLMKNTEIGDGKLFYFSSSDEDGSRKSGYQNVEFYDDTYQMYFKKNGEAVHGFDKDIKKFASYGIIMKANTDISKYGAVKATGTKNNWTLTDFTEVYDYNKISQDYETEDYILINASGSVLTKKTNILDENGYYYSTDANGKVVYCSDEKATKDENGKYEWEV